MAVAGIDKLVEKVSKREAIVRRILEGWSTKAIVKDLNEKGLSVSPKDVYQEKSNIRFYYKIIKDHIMEKHER